MKPNKLPHPTGTEIIEEASTLLRQASPWGWCVYLFGTGGFFLACLYTLANLSAGVQLDAAALIAGLGLALAFGVMKVAQSYFCNRLLAICSGTPDPHWNFLRVLRCGLQQMAVQPWGLILLPAAGVLVVPFFFVYAWMENHTLFANGLRSAKEAGALARAEAKRWPGQNHSGMLSLTLFGLVIMINAAAAILMLPGLLRSILGVELPIARVGYNFSNTTFFGVFFAITWLMVDPVVKAFYVIRCHRGTAMETGHDLIQQMTAVSKAALAALVIGVGIFVAAPGLHAETATISPVVETPVMDRTIDEVLARQEFQWRMPRITPTESEEQKSGWMKLMSSLIKWTRSVVEEIGQWWDAIGRFFNDLMPKSKSKPAGESGWFEWDWGMLAKWLLYILLALSAVLLLVMLLRQWRKEGRLKRRTAELVEPPGTPDLTREETQADALPEDAWLVLAREMMAKGEWRLAMRAVYFATLARLAAKDQITLTRAKTNRQYAREFARRARGREEWHLAFSQGVLAFERVWYGSHPADAAAVSALEALTQPLREELPIHAQ